MTTGEDPLPMRSNWSGAALAHTSDAVIVTDRRGRVHFLNPAAEALTGWTQKDACGQPFAAVFPIVNEQTGRPVGDPSASALAADAVAGVEDPTVVFARAGAEWVLKTRTAPLHEHAGEVVGVVLVFRDITERRRAARAAAEACAYAEGIVGTVRTPLVVLDAFLRVKTANRAFYQTFRASAAETRGRLLYELGNGQWDVPRLRELLEEILPANTHFDDFEVGHDFEGIGRRTMLLNARRIHREGSGTQLVLLAAEDVTERRRAEQAVSVSEARYRRLFETAQDGILIVDADERAILDVNPFLTEILGYEREELVGKELWEIGLFADIDANKAAFRQLQEQGYIRYEDLPLETKDGRRIDVEFVSNVYRVDRRRIIQCNVRDVTARKRAEAGLREAHARLERRVGERTADLARANESLKAEIEAHKQADAGRMQLLQQLITAQEEERHRIARELHDQMGQHLAALILGLKALKDATPEPSPARDRLQQLQQLTDLIGKEVHHLALELRPTALDDLGLETTLVNYVEEWSERSGVATDFHSTGLDKARLPPPLETALYRIVQEGLTNVVKHAGARHVSLIVQRSADQVLAILEDDGRGFDAEAEAGLSGPAGRLGLRGMRERATLFGGTVTVESAHGTGTTIFVRIPLGPEGREEGDG